MAQMLQKKLITQVLLFIVLSIIPFLVLSSKFLRSETNQIEPNFKLSVRSSLLESDSSKLHLSDEDIANRFLKRLNTLHTDCVKDNPSEYKRKHWVPIPHFLVDAPRHLLICVVPKTGSSSWHGMMWSIRRKRAGLDQDMKLYTANDTVYNHRMANNLSKEDGRMLGVYREGDDDLLKEPTENQSHRLVMSRHPFARLISGWKDKFNVSSNAWGKLFQKYPAMTAYKKSPPPRNFVIAFEDFARYISDFGFDMRALDYHFKPASYICKPCEYAYTYILKAECVDEEQDWLMRRLNLTDMDFVRRGVSNGTLLKRNPSEDIKRYFSKLDSKTIKKLYLVYEKDFHHFNYTFDFETLESGGFE